MNGPTMIVDMEQVYKDSGAEAVWGEWKSNEDSFGVITSIEKSVTEPVERVYLENVANIINTSQCMGISSTCAKLEKNEGIITSIKIISNNDIRDNALQDQFIALAKFDLSLSR